MRILGQLAAARSTAVSALARAYRGPGSTASVSPCIGSAVSSRIAITDGRQAHGFSTTTCTYKSKRSFVTEPAPDVVDDVPVMRTRGKGLKGGGKAKGGSHEDAEQRNDSARYRTTTKNADLPGESFAGSETLTTSMQRAVQRCRETVTRMIGSHGRADPSLLDSVRVTMPSSQPSRESSAASRQDASESHNIKEFATIGIRDGALLVTCFDPNALKYVERAIYAAERGLTPQRITDGDEDVLRVAIPRPTAETRAQLLRDVSKVCENARSSIRKVRQEGRKQITSDARRKVINQEEAASENKRVDDEMKKQTAEVDKLQIETQKRLERGD